MIEKIISFVFSLKKVLQLNINLSYKLAFTNLIPLSFSRVSAPMMVWWSKTGSRRLVHTNFSPCAGSRVVRSTKQNFSVSIPSVRVSILSRPMPRLTTICSRSFETVFTQSQCSNILFNRGRHSPDFIPAIKSLPCTVTTVGWKPQIQAVKPQLVA